MTGGLQRRVWLTPGEAVKGSWRMILPVRKESKMDCMDAIKEILDSMRESLKESPLFDVHEELKLKKQRPWRLSKCNHCGEAIHVIDEFIPVNCPICGRSR